MEEKKADNKEEHSEQHADSHSSKKKKPSQMMIIFGIILLVLIVLIVLVLTNVISLKPTSYTTTETYNLTYSVYGNGTLIETNTSTFSKDSVASSLGFASNKLD